MHIYRPHREDISCREGGFISPWANTFASNTPANEGAKGRGRRDILHQIPDVDVDDDIRFLGKKTGGSTRRSGKMAHWFTFGAMIGGTSYTSL